ncbi:MAG: 7-carboxy-7-deazaguanine synthase QueE [Chloroflexi bacterium]|nr:7-carboxy-7-deazaguanine synthase QueE [Chloroflexota bacterium]MDA1227186.1 7-carboxy-7-deazaguanine synthase QueE [Chloroflexota bacterium]
MNRADEVPLIAEQLKLSRQPSGEPEIFHSLQGEGHSVGTPTVFLRLALCNLTCSWCDTKYTWDWANFDPKKEILSLSLEAIEERILSYDCPHLVITGGEPMMQQDALAPLALSLKDKGFYIEVETNGTLAPNAEMNSAVSQWNVSPKLANSGVASDRREVPDALTAFAEIETAYFKFVMAQPQDVNEVLTLVDRYAIPPQQVILMPQGTTRKAIEEGSQWMTDLCTKHGFRFSTRMHILLWGDKRGR